MTPDELVAKLRAEWLAARKEYLETPTWGSFCKYQETLDAYNQEHRRPVCSQQ